MAHAAAGSLCDIATTIPAVSMSSRQNPSPADRFTYPLSWCLPDRDVDRPTSTGAWIRAKRCSSFVQGLITISRCIRDLPIWLSGMDILKGLNGSICIS